MVRSIKKLPRRTLFISAGVLAILIAALLYTLFPPKKVSTIPSTPAKTTTNNSPTKSPSTTSAKVGTGVSSGTDATQPNTSVSPTTELAAPFGSFVSNHHPGQDGSPTAEESTCNTTPGAHCFIQFTQGNIVKNLPSQTTDSSGATFWTWDIEQAGLTSGSWQIKATASLGGQSKSTTDPVALEVK